jgi:hypothetical protein
MVEASGGGGPESEAFSQASHRIVMALRDRGNPASPASLGLRRLFRFSLTLRAEPEGRSSSDFTW